MTDQDIMLNNPLHGLKLETLLEELVKQYGWEILAEYTRIKCFEKNVTMASSLKFLRKTEWAREKLERFYLYNFKNLPKADDVNFELPPRKRIIPAHQKPRDPVELVLGEAPEPKARGSFDNNRSDGRTNSRSGHGGGHSRSHSRNQSSDRNNRSASYSNKSRSSVYDNDTSSDDTSSSTSADPWANCRD